MSETTMGPEDAAAQRAAEQARLRKERREAKIKAGGSARLNKITGLGGRVPGEPEPAAATTTATDTASTPTPASAAASAAHHADPEEVDISEHYYEPKRAASRNAPAAAPEPALTEDQLRQMMLGFDRGNGTPGRASPAPGSTAAGDGLDEDPMMKMMSQLMAGAGFPPGSAPPFPGMPGMPGTAAPGQPPQPTAAVRSSASTNLWRLLHALVALGLGLYIVVLTPFTGSKIERERAALAGTSPADPLTAAAEPELETELEHRKRLFFWTFATAETLLLTTRFFLDKRGNTPTGVVGTVVGFLPQPAKGYIEIAMRYAQIFTTVRGDILACIFVLGAVSWWKG
ncbi:hypothetical protein ACJ41O_004703 [Fusarium nematophilum]